MINTKAQVQLGQFESPSGMTDESLSIISRQVASSLSYRFQQSFDKQESPEGEKWPALTPGRVLDKKGKNKILVDTGSLRHSQWIVKSSGNEAEVGSGSVYARIHNLGGVIKPKRAKALRFFLGGKLIITKSVKMPKRTFAEIGPKIKAFIENIVAKAIEGISSGAIK